MDIQVLPGILIEPPRPNYAGHIPIVFLEMNLQEPKINEGHLEEILVHRQLELTRDTILFRLNCDQHVPKTSLLKVALKIKRVVGRKRLVIAGFQPQFETNPNRYVLYSTRDRFPWQDHIPAEVLNLSNAAPVSAR